MAKKVTGYVKLQIAAGKATPAPPVGPARGQAGVNIMAFVKEFNVAEMNWVAWEPITEPREVLAKIRYRSVEQPAVLYPEGPKQIRVVLKDPARAVTPGQSTVFYVGDTVVGGGVIQKPS